MGWVEAVGADGLTKLMDVRYEGYALDDEVRLLRRVGARWKCPSDERCIHQNIIVYTLITTGPPRLRGRLAQDGV